MTILEILDVFNLKWEQFSFAKHRFFRKVNFGDYQAELYYFFDLQPLKPSLFAKVKSYDLIAACVQDNNVNIINKLI